jgi:zinc transporter, ZIP family
VAVEAARSHRLPLWISGTVPLLLIALLIGFFLVANPIASLRDVPPIEQLAVERVVLSPGEIELKVRNDGPDAVSVAQVLVNDAYRSYESSDNSLGRLETSTFVIEYPWDEGLPLSIGLVTSTGAVIEHDIEAAALTPAADASTLWVYALLGLYIGIIPVAVGLLWFPALRAAGAAWIAFFLAFTVGLLLFLLVDTVAEGFELAAESAASLDGLGLFSTGALGAVVGMVVLERYLESRRDGRLGALATAYLVAAGIGLHNLGEGLAVGAALAAGEAALGTFLVLGFAVHNTTEGLAIVAPIGSIEARPTLWHFAALGALAGAPAIVGAIAGGVAFSPAWVTFAFGVGAGAIAQVAWQIGRGLMNDGKARSSVALGLLAGFVVMYLTGLLT